MNNLQEAIRRLQLNNRLVVLRCCGGSGERQLLSGLTQGYTTLDLSLPNLRLQVEQNARLFIENLTLPTYLANLHYAPPLLRALLRSEAPLGQIIADCTQSYYLQAAAAETGAERAAFLDLPLTQDAGLRQPFVPTAACLSALGQERREVFGAILRGGLGLDDLGGYISDVVQREIMEQTTVSDAMKLYRFLCVAASMTGTVVNYSRLCSGVGITAPTAKQWLQFLAGAGVVWLLQPLGELDGKRIVKAPKLYFRDTGTAAKLLQIGDAGALAQSFYLKNLLDNYVVNAVRESYLRRGEEPGLVFYQDSNYKEISMILQRDNMLYPVNICKDGFSVRKVKKSFELLGGYAEQRGATLGDGCVIGLGGEVRRLEEGLYYVPAEYL